MHARPVRVVRAPVPVGAPVHLAVGQRAVGRDVLGDEVDDVHAEAVDAAVEPPPHHRVDRLADVGVLPVEVRLLGVEQVQVVRARGLVEPPRAAPEERAPVRRLGARGARLHALARGAPPVPVAPRALRGRARLDEPRVLVARVVDDEVHDELHPARVQPLDQGVEVCERPEQRVDVLVVADVVAVVRLRRPVHRGQPTTSTPSLSRWSRRRVIRGGPRRRRRRCPGTSAGTPGTRPSASTRARPPASRHRATPAACVLGLGPGVLRHRRSSLLHVVVLTLPDRAAGARPARRTDVPTTGSKDGASTGAALTTRAPRRTTSGTGRRPARPAGP